MNLIFLRHGETAFNVEDRFQGASDSPLTQNGIHQAEQMNNYLKKNFVVNKFLISPLPRVKQTYEIASKEINANLEVIDDLREICYGSFEEKKRSEIDPKILEERKPIRYSFVHPGIYNGVKGESYKMLYERISPLLNKLAQAEGDIAIISHHGVMLAVMKFFENLTEEQMNSIQSPNNQVIIISRKSNLDPIVIRKESL